MARDFDFYRLEDRVLLSGEGLDGVDPADAGTDPHVVDALLAEATAADGHSQTTLLQPDQTTQYAQPEHDAPNSLADEDGLPLVLDPTQPIEVVFVDEGVEDFETLLDDLRSGGTEQTQWVLIRVTGESDGIETITDSLATLSGVDAVHVISHGDGDGIQLGNTRLDAASLGANAGDIATWADAMDADADLLIYGCDLASTDEGRMLIDSIAALCDCDVAASDDATGHESLGGDWEFEYLVGNVTTEAAFSIQAQSNWHGTLDTTTGLIGHFEFDNDTGTTAVDSSATGNDGTYINTPTLTSGVIGTDALDFDGDTLLNKYVSIPDDSAYDFGTSEFTVAFWYNSTSAPTGNSRLVGSDDGSTGFSIYADNSNDLNFFFEAGGNSGTVTHAGGFINDGNWHHVAAVHNATEFRLFVDGVSLVAEGDGSIGAISPAAPITIGASDASTNDYDGLIDDVRIYDRGLTTNDVGELHAMKPDLSPTDLIATVDSDDGGLALNTDGGNDAYLLTNDDSLLDGMTNLTMEFQFSDLQVNGAEATLYSHHSGTSSAQLAVHADGTLEFLGFTSANTYSQLIGSGDHHLAMTWDPSTGEIQWFVDGQFAEAVSGPTGTIAGGGGAIAFGQDMDSIDGNYDSDEAFSGVFRDIRIFDSIRTSLEIANNFDQTVPVDETDIVANWRFNTLSSDGTVFESISGNDLSVSNVGAGSGYTPSVTELALAIDENASNGTIVGQITGIDPERQALIASLLAVNPDLVYLADSNVFVEFNSSPVDWDTAQANAMGSTLNGASGFLATITTASENEQIRAAAQAAGLTGIWLGGSDDGVEGQWQWHHEGVAGEQFADGSGNSINGLFTNFGPLEPDGGSGENHLEMDVAADEWNDLNKSSLRGYVIEYDADEVLDGPGNPTDQPLVYTIESQTVAGAFAINGDTGVITVADGSLLDYETDPLHTLSVRVEDIAGNQYDEDFDVEIKAVNVSPSIATNTGVTVNEGASVTITAGMLNEGDPDDSGAGLTYTVTGLGPSEGQLELTTNSGVAISDFTQDDIDNNRLIYVHSGSEGSVDSFTFSLADGGEDGATPAAGSFSIAVSNINESPVIAGLDATTFIEDGVEVVLDSDVTITDPELSDSDNFTGATLHLQRDGGASSDDFFVAAGLLGTLTEGQSFDYDGTNVGNVVANSGGELTLQFNANADQDTVNSVAQSIAFGNTDNTPPASVDIAWTFNDNNSGSQGSGPALAGSAVQTVNITATNDAPTISFNSGATFNEGSTGNVIGNPMLREGDPDDGGVGITYTLTSAPTHGTLKVNGTEIGLNGTFTQRDINIGLLEYDHDGNDISSTDSFDFSLADGGEDGTSPVAGTFNISINAVNDEQVLSTNTGTSVNEGSSSNIITALMLETTDNDHPTNAIEYTVTSVSSNGNVLLNGSALSLNDTFTQADIDANLLTYDHDGSETTTDTFGFDVDDGIGSTSSGIFNLTITAVNDEQVLSTNTGTSVNEGSSGNIISTLMLEATDNDHPTNAIEYTVTSVSSSGDVLLNGSVLSLNDTFTQADIDANLLTYDHDGSETTTDTFGFDVDDGVGSSSSGIFTLNVVPENDAPNLDLDANDSSGQTGSDYQTGFLEGAGPVNIVDNDGFVVDPDSSNLTSILITLTNSQEGGNKESLAADTTGTSLTAIWNSGTDALTISGTGTVADYEQVLKTVQYDNTSKNPNTSIDRIITFTASDGTDTSQVATTTLTVSEVNDPPETDPITVNSVEDTSSVTVNLSGSDVDGIVQSFSISNLSPGGTFFTDALLTNQVIAGHDYAATANSLTLFFQPDADFDGTTTFDFAAKDNLGSADPTPAIGTLNFSAINDAPVIAVNNGAAFSEASIGNTITTLMLNEGDVDDDGSEVTYTLTTATSNGTLRVNGAAIGIGATFSQADIDGALVTYDHDGTETTSDSFDFTLADGGEDGSTPALGTFSLTINAVNDEQVLATNTGTTVDEGSTGNTITTAMLETTDADHSAAQLTYTITSAAGNGTVFLNSSALGLNDTFTQADVDAGLVTYDHDSSETLSDSFTFSVNDGVGTTTTGTFNWVVDPINDAPVNQLPSTQVVPEDEILTLSVANGNAISVVDTDSAGDAIQVTLSATNGVLNVATTLGLTVSGDGTATVTLTGPNANITAALDGLSFTPTPSYNGPATITIDTNDLGGNGSGGALTDSDVLNINVASVNDAPVLNNAGTPTLTSITEDDINNDGNSVSAMIATGFGGDPISDIEGDPEGIAIESIATPGNGTWQYSLDGGASWSDIGTASSTNALLLTGSDRLRYVPDGENADNAVLTWKAWDQTTGIAGGRADVSVSGGATAFSVASESTSITVTAEDDAPEISGTNLITNGDFATGDTTGWSTSGQVTNDGSPNAIRFGEFDTPTSGVASQTFATVIGETYELVFSYGDDRTTFDQDMRVTVNGSSQLISQDVNSGVGNNQMAQFAFSFTADSTTTTLNFTDISASSVGVDGYVDDVTVSQLANLDYNENDAPTALDPGIRLTDVDSSTLSGAIVQITGNYANGEDVLSFADQFGISGNFSAATGTLTLSGVSSVSNYETALRTVLYHNTSQNPSEMERTVTWTVNDGGLISRDRLSTIEVTAINDDPSNTASLPTDVSVVEDILSNVDLSSINLSDVDDPSSNLTVTLTTSTGGNLTTATSTGVTVTGDGTGTVTLSGTQADLNAYLNDPASIRYQHLALNTDGDNADTIQVDVSDNGNFGAGGGGTINLGTVNVDIASVNDAPILGNNSLTIDEGATVVITTAHLDSSDVDNSDTELMYAITNLSGGQFELTSNPGVAVTTFDRADVIAGTVLFVHDGNENAPAYDVTILDGALSDGPHSATITFTNLNDDTANTGSLPTDLSVNEDVTTAINLSSITLEDPDAYSGNVTLTLSTNTGGILAATTGGGVTVTGSGSGNLILNGTLSDLNAFIDNTANVTYTGVLDVNGDDIDSIDVVVNDNGGSGIGGGTNVSLGSINVDIAAVNDAPILGNNTLTIDEAATVAITTANLDSSDVDNTNAELNYTITNLSGGQFESTAAPGVAILSFTRAEVIAGTIVFVHDGNENAPAYDVTVFDGALTDGPQAATINFTNFNDDPTNSGFLPSDVAVNEDVTTAIDLSGITLSDPDSYAGNVTFTLSTNTGGVLAASSNGGVTITGSGSSTLVLNGTLTDLNTFIDNTSNITYTGVLDVNGNDIDAIDVVVNDNGGSGVGSGGNINLGSIDVDIAAVNDAPILGTNSLTIDEGATVTITTGDLNSSDVDNTDAELTYHITNLSGGQFESTGNPGVAITSFTRADVVAGSILFVHNGNENAPAYDVTVVDGALSDGPQAATISFTNFNDDPTNSGFLPSDVAADEDVTTSIDLSGITLSDPDAYAGNMTLTLSTNTGGVLGAASGGGVVVTGNGTSTLVLNGTLTDLNTFIDNVSNISYTGVLNVNGNDIDAIDVVVTDNGGSGVGGGTNINLGSINVDIGVVNDAPILGNNTLTIDEGATVAITTANLDSSDVDNTDAQLNYIITNLSGGQFESTSNPGVAITSFTRADVTAGSIVFVHDGNEAAPAYEVTVVDGALSDGPYAATVNFTNFNDDPINSGFLHTDISVNEDVTTPIDLSGITLVDPDSYAGNVTLTLTANSGGILAATTGGGVTVTGSGSGNLILNGTLSDLNAFIDNTANVTYTGVLDVNGNDIDSIDVVVSDNGGSGVGGGTDISLGSINVDIIAVNDAPILGNNTLTIDEGATVAITTANLDSSDVDNTDAQLTYNITNLSGGQFELASNPGLAITSFTRADVIAGLIVFVHDGNEAAPAYDVTVFDGGLTDGPNAATVGFTNFNDDPINSGTLPTDISVNEDITTGIDLSSINLLDPDSYAGNVTLTLSTNNGGVLGASAGGGVLVSGAGSGTLILNGTLADLNTFIDNTANITYTGVLDVNGNDIDSIDIVVSDNGGSGIGGGSNISLGSINVDIAAVNDAPILGNNNLTIDEGQTVAITTANLDSSDVDNTNAQLSYNISNLSGGQFELTTNPGLAITSFTRADVIAGLIAFVHDGNEAAPVYDVTVFDGALTDGPQSATVGFTNFNDDPINSGTLPTDLSVNEDVTTALNLSSITFADPDSYAGNVTVTLTTNTGGILAANTSGGVTVTGSGSGTLILDGALADLNAFIDNSLNITYTGVLDVNGNDADTIDITITDNGGSGVGGGSTINLGTINVDIAAVNDAPIQGNNTLTINEGETVVLTTANLDSIDVDNTDSQLVYSISNLSGGHFEHLGNPGLAITTFNQDDVNAGRIAFVHDGNEAAPAYDVTIFDGALTDGPNAATINYTNVNDDPTNDGGLPFDASLLEDGNTNLDVSAINLADVDAYSGNLTLTLSSNTGGILAAASGAGVTVSGSGTTSIILNGTIDDLNAFVDDINNVQYFGALNANGDNIDTIDVVINDNGNTGIGGGTDIALGIVNVDIIAVNDDPTNIGSLVNSVTVIEDTPSDIDFSAVEIDDVDAGTSPVTVVLTAGQGTLTAVSANGVTISGSGTSSLTLDGSQTAINAYMDGASRIQYTGVQDRFGANVDTIDLFVSDNGNVGLGGGSMVHMGTANVNIIGVNDAPVAVPDTYSVLINNALILKNPTPELNDIDVDGDRLRFTIISGPVHGQLVTNANGDLIYIPNAGYHGSDTILYRSHDGVLASQIETITIEVLGGSAGGTDTGGVGSTGTDVTPGAIETTRNEQETEEDLGDAPTSPSMTFRPKTTDSDQTAEVQFELVDAPTQERFQSADESQASDLLFWQGSSTTNSFSEDVAALLHERMLMADISNVVASDDWNRAEDEGAFNALIVGTAEIGASLFSIGFALWVLRGGAFAAVLMSSLPSTFSVDPAIMLEAYRGAKTGNAKEGVDALFD